MTILDTGWLPETIYPGYEEWKVQNEGQDLYWVKVHSLVTRQLSSQWSHIAEEQRALSGGSFLSTYPNHKGSILVPLIASHEPHPPPNTITSRIKILNAWVWGHKYWAHKQPRRVRKKSQYTLARGWGAKRKKLPTCTQQGQLHLERASQVPPRIPFP